MRITKTPKAEKLISIFLLILLTLFSLLVLKGNSLFRPAAVSPTVMLSGVAAGRQLPPGWQLEDGWQTYPEEKLYEKINGRAPLFQEHGLIQLDFASASKDNFFFDIYMYKMKNSYAALGIYLEEYPSASREIDLGTRADIAGAMVRVYQNSIYLVIMPLDKESSEKPALDLASFILQEIEAEAGSEDTVETTDISADILSLFPAKGLIKRSLRFNKNSTFGLGSLNNIFSIDCQQDNIIFQYLLKPDLSGKETVDLVLKDIETELREFGAEIIQADLNTLAGKIFGQYIFLSQQKNMLLGVYGPISHDQAWEKLEVLRISTAKNNK